MQVLISSESQFQTDLMTNAKTREAAKPDNKSIFLIIVSKDKLICNIHSVHLLLPVILQCARPSLIPPDRGVGTACRCMQTLPAFPFLPELLRSTLRVIISTLQLKPFTSNNIQFLRSTKSTQHFRSSLWLLFQ